MAAPPRARIHVFKGLTMTSLRTEPRWDRGHEVARIRSRTEPAIADLQRLADCWNACGGDPGLVRALAGALHDFIGVAVGCGWHEAEHGPEYTAPQYAMLEKARAALAKLPTPPAGQEDASDA